MAERRNNYQIQVIGGEKLPGADIGYAIELIDGLRIFVQLWHGDEEFPH